jgi:hypothetical protein
LPRLKREAISEIILKRHINKPLDENKKRINLLKKVSQLIVNHHSVLPISLKEGSFDTDIEKMCEKARESFKQYSVKPVLKKVI